MRIKLKPCPFCGGTNICIMDMEICEIEGWDKTEYINQIKQLINSIGGKQ